MIICGEITYLFYWPKITAKTDVVSRSVSTLTCPTPTPYPRIKTGDEAVFRGSLDYLYNLHRDTVKSLILTADYEGIVSDVNTKGGLYDGTNDNYKYLYSVTTVDAKGEGNTLYLNDIDIKKTSVKKKNKTTSVLTDAGLNDIQVGQTLEIIKKTNLYYTQQTLSDHLISVEMYIIE